MSHICQSCGEQSRHTELVCPSCGVLQAEAEMPLFGICTPSARSTDPSTSHDAAASVSGLSSRREAVLFILSRLGGEGDDSRVAREYEALREAYRLPKQSPSGLRTRRAELVTLGRVEDSGRKTKLETGRRSIVWRIAGDGC